MSHPVTCLFAAVVFAILPNVACGQATALYLMDGTVVRGEILDRTAKVLEVKTASGVVKVKTARLMPISRQQLRLPADAGKVEPDKGDRLDKADKLDKSEMEALLNKFAKVLAENAALKEQVALLRSQLAQSQTAALPGAKTPAEASSTRR